MSAHESVDQRHVLRSKPAPQVATQAVEDGGTENCTSCSRVCLRFEFDCIPLVPERNGHGYFINNTAAPITARGDSSSIFIYVNVFANFQLESNVL